MILYEGGPDVPLRSRNTSQKYFTGTTWPTNNCGYITIIGQAQEYYLDTKCVKNYKYFVVHFSDGTLVKVQTPAIISGNIKNPNKPMICEVGFLGQGDNLCRVNGKKTKEYVIWTNMLERCYSTITHNKRNRTYKECTVDKRWHNFQNFCEDIKHLTRYKNWKEDKHKRNHYELDKDIKEKGNKIYSKDTCIFATSKENANRYNKAQTITGLTYIGTRLSDGYKEEFTNQRAFCQKYNLNPPTVTLRLKGNTKPYLGWIFEVKEET